MFRINLWCSPNGGVSVQRENDSVIAPESSSAQCIRNIKKKKKKKKRKKEIGKEFFYKNDERSMVWEISRSRESGVTNFVEKLYT